MNSAYTYNDIAKMIDHSLLNPTLTASDLEAGCRLALAYDVASVCILPYYLKRCAEILQGSTVKASTTIGFPHGGHTTAVKEAEARQAVDDGCEELDMVVNISQVLSGNWDDVRADIKAVIEVAHAAATGGSLGAFPFSIHDRSRIQSAKAPASFGHGSFFDRDSSSVPNSELFRSQFMIDPEFRAERGSEQSPRGVGRKVKVIFENCYLNRDQKIRLCEICGELKADWVKTSTGYGTGGATSDDLKLMRMHAPERVQVKAAGGIRDMDRLLEVRALGVTRVGASRTKEMLDECRHRLGLEPILFEGSS